MIDLYKYITESIFDDDKQIDNIDTSAWDMLFKKHSGWYVGKDNKTIFDIVFDDIDWQRLDIHNPQLEKDWIESLVKYGLKFQPLPHLDMDINKNQDINLLNNIPVDTVVGLTIKVANENTVVDLSGIKYDITNNIHLRFNDDITHSDIIHYSKKVDLVEFTPWREDLNLSVDDIKGWDCNELYVAWDINTINTSQIQTLIDNNPKVKDFYLWNSNNRKYAKIKTIGSKRIFDKYIIRQPKGINQRYDELDKVCDWINSRSDIFPHEKKEARKKELYKRIM
jgi:hypothetical protein